jgi:hypothetical protein
MTGSRRRLSWLVALAALAIAAIAILAAPQFARASGCTDSWTGLAGDGQWTTAGNWSTDQVPTLTDDVCITLSGTYTVTVGGVGGVGSTSVDSLTIGGSSGTQTLEISGINSSGNTILTAGSVTNDANGSILLDCLPAGSTPCTGGAVSLQTTSGPLTNAGTITTTAANTANLLGDITNTGTLAIGDSSAFFGQGSAPSPVALDNEGTIALADGAELSTGSTITNDTGGSINATGSGTLDSDGVFNEGAGTTSGATPVTLMNQAALNLTGDGASSFVMSQDGGFHLSGTLANSQSLTVDGQTGAGNLIVDVAPGFTNAGSILVDCSVQPGNTPCSGNGEILQVTGGGTMTNSGTITTTTAGAADLLGNITNTGTLTIEDATGFFGQGSAPSPVTLDNEGTIALADGAELSTGETITNDTGGSIDATGSGTLDSAGVFNEGAGTTTGSTPVTLMNQATLNLTGDGASSFVMSEDGGFSLSGALASSQSLTVEGQTGAGNLIVDVAPGFTNAGSMLIECFVAPDNTPCSGGLEELQGTGGTLVNTGTITAAGANSVAVQGNLTNDGTLAIGAGGTVTTLLVGGDYVQGADGVLALQVDGVSAGAFSALDVEDHPTLAGTLSLAPSEDYASSALSGNSAEILDYGGTRTGTFSAATVSPQSTAPPVVSGTPTLGRQLSCSQGSFTDSPTSYAYQWNRDGVPISGATASTYTVVSADTGHVLSCTVTASGGAPLAGGKGFSAVYDDAETQVDAVVGSTFTPGSTSATSGAPAIAAAPQSIAAPVISGTAEVGDELSCSQGSWLNAPTSFAYQWNRDINVIAGASSSTYTVDSADAGHSITCTVTASNASGSAASTSNALSVAVPPPPPITVTPGTLAQAVGANPYSQALTACGGSLPSCEHYSSTAQALVDASGATVAASSSAAFSLSGGSLPPGISLSALGLLSGAPTQSGAFEFTVSAADPAGASAAIEYVLTVSPGISVQQPDEGSFTLGGAIPAGSVTISPNGSGAITSVSMSNGGNSYVPVTGVTGAVTEFGLQVSGTGSSCSTSLQLAGASGVALSATGLLTNGCSQSASATSLARASDTRTATARSTASRASSRSATPSAREIARARQPAPAASDLMVAGSVQALAVGTGGVANSSVEIGAVGSEGDFGVDIAGLPAVPVTGPIRVTVQGGVYDSELDGVNQETSFTLSALTDSVASIPAVPSLASLSEFFQSASAMQAPTTTIQSLEAIDGFPTGTTAEEIVPQFAADTGGAEAALSSELGNLEADAAAQGLTDRGSLVTALAQDISDGVFDGQANGTPLPMSGGVLPPTAGTSLFLAGVNSFAAAQSATIPPLPSAVSTITPALPVTTIPVVPANITRIGPQAFTETLTANNPALARSPFSSASDSFEIEVVG